jgi:uncharacterized protein (TIGR02444 family)
LQFPASPFWDFSLRLYARPGVASSCLRLQERHGIDVNILFCALWRGMAGQVCTRRDIVRMVGRVRALHEEVVKPLRTARTALKGLLATEAGEHVPAMGALRAAIKKDELDAEHLEQIVLAAASPNASVQPGGADLAKVNATVYFAVHGAKLGRRDHSDLAGILGALDGETTAAGDSLRAPANRLGRRRVLARAGGGA